MGRSAGACPRFGWATAHDFPIFYLFVWVNAVFWAEACAVGMCEPVCPGALLPVGVLELQVLPVPGWIKAVPSACYLRRCSLDLLLVTLREVLKLSLQRASLDLGVSWIACLTARCVRVCAFCGPSLS